MGPFKILHDKGQTNTLNWVIKTSNFHLFTRTLCIHILYFNFFRILFLKELYFKKFETKRFLSKYINFEYYLKLFNTKCHIRKTEILKTSTEHKVKGVIKQKGCLQQKKNSNSDGIVYHFSIQKNFLIIFTLDHLFI